MNILRKLDSQAVEWANKGLMAVSSPSAAAVAWAEQYTEATVRVYEHNALSGASRSPPG